MPESKEDINAILSELRKVLSDLTKEEKEHAEDTIERKLDEIKYDEKKQISSKSVYPTKIEESVQYIKKPEQEAIKPAPPEIKEEVKLPEVQKEEKTQEKFVFQQESQIIEKPVEKELPQEQFPVTSVNIEQPIKEVPLHAEQLQQQEHVFETVPQLQAEVLKEAEKESKVIQEITPAVYIPALSGDEKQVTCPVLNISFIYPSSAQSIKEVFIKNLTEIIKKTSKKPFYFKVVIEKTYDDIDKIDWNAQLSEFVASNIQVVFFISPQKMDFSEIVNLYKSSDILFMVMTTMEVTKKITYVDMIIELMLTKKIG